MMCLFVCLFVAQAQLAEEALHKLHHLHREAGGQRSGEGDHQDLSCVCLFSSDQTQQMCLCADL